MSQTRFINMEPERLSVRRFALFEYGFRPFFLAAASYAALVVPIWIALWRGDTSWQPPMPPSYWHGHEMLFGFAVAALAGFMLTAVPNWTGEAAIRGSRLVLLVAVWASARVAAFLPLPHLFAAVDLAFLPLLVLMLGPGILLRNGRRNGILVGILLLLALLNSAVHFDGWGFASLSSSWALQVAIAVFALLIGLIGGRIVPAFTQGGMKMSGVPLAISGHRMIDGAALMGLFANLLATAIMVPSAIAGGIAAFAALANLLRFLRWQGWRTLSVPLVWILHLGYGWLIVGLALNALADFNLLPPSMGYHALTVGSFATMIMAVMSRASLGHTGRALVADRYTCLAYLLLTAAAALRVVAPMFEQWYSVAVEGAAILWSAAFLVFATRYVPILVAPRPDGRTG